MLYFSTSSLIFQHPQPIATGRVLVSILINSFKVGMAGIPSSFFWKDRRGGKDMGLSYNVEVTKDRWRNICLFELETECEVIM